MSNVKLSLYIKNIIVPSAPRRFEGAGSSVLGQKFDASKDAL
jgi:hypothetical protein